MRERLGNDAGALSAYLKAVDVVPDYEPSIVAYALLLARTGKAALSRPYASSRKPGRPSLTLAAPVRDAAGRIVGQLRGGAWLYGPNLVGDLATTPIGEGGYFAILDRQRVRVAQCRGHVP